MKQLKCKEADLNLYKRLEEKRCYEDTRYYGVFISKSANNRKIKIDVQRYHKIIGLSEKQLVLMKKRRSHCYMPSKKSYEDYNCNLIIPLIEKILTEWEVDYRPLIEKEIKAIQAKEYSPGDDELFACGIIDHEEACISALINSIRAFSIFNICKLVFVFININFKTFLVDKERTAVKNIVQFKHRKPYIDN